jgi:hypothetical protein
MKSKFPGAVPEIPVRDINEAAAYYESNLGFTVDWGGEELGLAGICSVFSMTSRLQNAPGMPNKAMHASVKRMPTEERRDAWIPWYGASARRSVFSLITPGVRPTSQRDSTK